MLRLFFALPVVLSACLKDEAVSGYVDPGMTFQLVEMNGQKFDARATISFPARGNVRGKGPCNTYAAPLLAPYPWFELGPMAATLARCSDPREGQFFATLKSMTQIEVGGNVLVLRDDNNDEMVFNAVPAGQ